MDIKFKKWFTNGDKTRYKVVLPSSDFTNLPTSEVSIGLEFQVIKGDGGYRLTLFGERRKGWLESVGVTPTGLSWCDETLNLTNGISQWSTPWMRKKDLVAVIERIVPLEIASWRDNDLIKPQFRDLKLV